MTNEYRTTCWYCGEKLTDSTVAELDKHAEKGVSHGRFLTEIVVPVPAAETEVKTVPLEEGLTGDPAQAQLQPAPKPTESETDASIPK